MYNEVDRKATICPAPEDVEAREPTVSEVLIKTREVLIETQNVLVTISRTVRGPEPEKGEEMRQPESLMEASREICDRAQDILRTAQRLMRVI